MQSLQASKVQTTFQKLSVVSGAALLGKWLGVEPVMMMFWMFAGWACVLHVLLMWWMPPYLVSYFLGDGIFLGNVSFVKSLRDRWVKCVTYVEELRTGSVVWWRVLWIFYALWAMAMQGPVSIIMHLIGNPDTSRVIGMGVIAPLGMACYLWVFMNPRYPFIDLAIKFLPSGWIEPPGSTESIVWVTILMAGMICGSVEFMNAFYPPIVKLALGDMPVPVFHASIMIAAGFSCVMAGVEVDGNHVSKSDDSDPMKKKVESYERARSTHMAVLGVSLVAVATAYVVLPALDRQSFLSGSMRPMHLVDNDFIKNISQKKNDIEVT